MQNPSTLVPETRSGGLLWAPFCAIVVFMKYRDTRDASRQVSFKTAVLQGMDPRHGRFVYSPWRSRSCRGHFCFVTPVPSFRDIAFEAAKPFVSGEVPDADLMGIIADAYPFTAPVAPIDPSTYVLELFHGPTCAFKDFGARFMARMMSYFNRGEDKPLHILVATSGDTGSAVGSAFYGVPGIDVTILYPEGKISKLQEKQLSTFDGNVRALSVSGTFGRLPEAREDGPLPTRSSAGSSGFPRRTQSISPGFCRSRSTISTDRSSFASAGPYDSKIENPSLIVTVPSGNFGNLTSGAHGAEDGRADPRVHRGDELEPDDSRLARDGRVPGARFRSRPLSNAMDVGSPSNYERIAGDVLGRGGPPPDRGVLARRRGDDGRH